MTSRLNLVNWELNDSGGLCNCWGQSSRSNERSLPIRHLGGLYVWGETAVSWRLGSFNHCSNVHSSLLPGEYWTLICDTQDVLLNFCVTLRKECWEMSTLATLCLLSVTLILVYSIFYDNNSVNFETFWCHHSSVPEPHCSGMLPPCPCLLCLTVCCLLCCCCCCEVWPVAVSIRDMSSKKDGDKQTLRPVISPETRSPLPFWNCEGYLQEFLILFYWFCNETVLFEQLKAAPRRGQAWSCLPVTLFDVNTIWGCFENFEKMWRWRAVRQSAGAASVSETRAAHVWGLLCSCHCTREQMHCTHWLVSNAVRFTCGRLLLKGIVWQLVPQIEPWFSRKSLPQGAADDVFQRVLVRNLKLQQDSDVIL